MKKINYFFLTFLFGATLIAPLLQISCSSGTNQNQNIPPVQLPDNTNINGMHELNLQQITSAQSPLNIIKQTTPFKKSIKDVQNEIDKESWDFLGANKHHEVIAQEVKQFNKLNQEVGISNEYGKDIYQKMTNAPRKIDNEYNMVQKYLPNFANHETTNAIPLNIDINDLIKNNQFGYLPSNLSQLLYYCDLEGISQIFNIANVKEIKMNFDDEIGSADILIEDNANRKFIFNYLSSTTDALKKNNDFRQYIFDRSFVISYPRMIYSRIESQPFSPISSMKIQSPGILHGTGWVFDRILDDTIPQGFYDFLVGTNLHILDVSKAYNKERKLATNAYIWSADIGKPTSALQHLYNDKWDGGFLTRSGVNTSNNAPNDEIENIAVGSNNIDIYQQVKGKRHADVVNSVVLSKSKFNDNNNAGGDNDIDFDPNTTVKTQLNNENIVNDLVYYTPSFKSTGTYTERSSFSYPVFDLKPGYNKQDFIETETDQYGGTKDKWYENYNGRRTGNISNAGADFGITRIRLSKSDIQKVLPSLYQVLDTNQEQEWYMGMGIDNSNPVTLSANSTLFIGGYPKGKWKSIKSNSGKIYSQQRFIAKDDSSSLQTYWTKYNESDNAKYNEYRGMVDWYKQRFTSPSMNSQQNDKNMPHGMQIQKVLQQSFITFSNEGKHSENDILLDGSSGSMIINSRFELSGILFALRYDSNNNLLNNDDLTFPDANQNSFTNMGYLFKNYTQANQSFNIIQQFKDKLVRDNIKTFKLNPRR